jgi:protein-disulfide isomerase
MHRKWRSRRGNHEASLEHAAARLAARIGCNCRRLVHMNTKKLTILTVLGIIVIAFFFGMNKYQRGVQESQEQKATQQDSRLVRMHSPVFGPQNARVTIVEFFDPACEACRAFYRDFQIGQAR